jgi:ribosomal protein S1
MFVGDHEELEPPEDDEEIYQDSPRIGSQVTGRVIAIYDDGALVAIHGKESAFLPIDEAGLKEVNDMHDVVEVDELIKAEMVGSYKGRAIISLRNARLIEAWDKVMTMRAANEAFEVEVLEVNRGGATVEAIDGLVGFLPVSHYANGGKPMDESLIGTTLTVIIFTIMCCEDTVLFSSILNPYLHRSKF